MMILLSKGRLLFASAVGLSLLLAACKTTEEALIESGAAPMTAEAIKALVSNKTVNGINEKGVKWVVYYDPNGEARGRANWTGGSETDTGKWEVTADDMFCSQYKKWRDGKLRCWQLYDQGGKLTWVGKKGPAQTEEDDNTWREGNVENL